MFDKNLYRISMFKWRVFAIKWNPSIFIVLSTSGAWERETTRFIVSNTFVAF